MTTAVRVARFWGVGALGFVVQMATLAGLADGLDVPIALATAAAVSAALVHNFCWHRLWTWADRRDGSVVGAFTRFVAANGVVSLIGNVVITTVLSGWLALPALVANGVAVVACCAVNFLLGDTVVFKRTITPA